MNLSQTLLPEFDHEMSTTRRLLERVPFDKASWKPHEKSTSLGNLAIHLAQLPSLVSRALHTDELDFSRGYTPPKVETTQELLALFDQHVAEGRDALANADDEAFLEPWTMRSGDRVIFRLPKAGVVRTMVLNHVIHHRGQLSVYLRLNNVPLPSIYGPTADEPMV
ncbi:MAG TPA: DinB family protein [Thermoanaerobaculia bacterium]|jgi:uncharacterized damage-inducible protein DinB